MPTGVLAAIVLVALLVAGWLAWHPTREDGSLGDAPAVACRPLDHQHAAWSAILDRYVQDGWVDYAGLAKNRDELDRYLRALESVCPADYQRWTTRQRLAFWIDAYNAYTVKLILDHYPVGSIREIGLLPGAAFGEPIAPMHALRGRTLSLDDIEHTILRGEFDESRIHFALVCAARSCPVLRSEAYRGTDVDRQPEEQARRFVRDPARNRFDPRAGTAQLSSIFSWFREDF